MRVGRWGEGRRELLHIKMVRYLITVLVTLEWSVTHCNDQDVFTVDVS